MSAVDWEEVKRLAADFQRAQLSTGAQRLSERNCIEIIARLVEEKLIEVIFTTDGKEYITPKHLLNEIKDELYVSGGRINLVDVAKNLSVDLSIITKRAAELDKSEASIRIVNGQLISNAFINNLCLEIDEKLSQQGQISIDDLTSQFDLPSDFLLDIIEKEIGKQIHGIQDKQDCKIFFTSAFVKKNLSVVRGALTAITKPISTSTLVSLCGVSERLFFSAVDSLVELKEMPGVLTGKQKISGQYVPYIYTKSQVEWVNSFFQQNGYLEYAGLTRIGLSDPAGFIQKNFSKANLLMLPSVAVGPTFLDQVEAAVDEAISTATFVKLLQVVPSNFEPEDADALLQKVLQKKAPSQNLHVYNTTTVVTDPFMRSFINKFNSSIEESVKNYVKSGEYVKNVIERNQQSRNILEEKVDTKVDKKEERRKKAAEGKGGGGTQGRETKTKSTKKKYMKGKQQQQEDSDDEQVRSAKGGNKFFIVKKEDISNTLQNEELFQDEDDEALLEEVVEYLHPLLNRKALEMAQVMFESTIASVNQNRRKKHAELQEKLSNLLLNVKLFDKGIKQFESQDVSQQLTKYLLKSVCTDIVNQVFLHIANEHSKLFEDAADLTTEQRIQVLNEAPSDMRESLLKLHKSLTGSSIEDFLSSAETAIGPGVSDIMVVRHDKKKERPQMLHLRQQLIEQLNVADDPALVLHLATLIVFQAHTQTVLHASGKFVSNIVTFLHNHVEPDVFNTLRRYHDLVLQFLSNAEQRATIGNTLQDEIPLIREIAFAAKKNAGKGKERTTSTTSN